MRSLYFSTIMYYEKLFDALNQNQVHYVVVGGVALVLHGVVRLTADLDLMVHLERLNLTRFVDVMNRLGYKPKVPVQAEDLIDSNNRARWIKEKNMKVFSFFHQENAVNLIDIFVIEPVSYEEIEKNSVIIKAGETIIPIASKKGLIELKRISGRPQDMADIAALEELIENGQ